MALTKEQLEKGLKYEIDLSRKLKKELKRIEEELKKCQVRMVKYNSALINIEHLLTSNKNTIETQIKKK
jgi:hypothetical protein